MEILPAHYWSTKAHHGRSNGASLVQPEVLSRSHKAMKAHSGVMKANSGDMEALILTLEPRKLAMQPWLLVLEP